MSAEVILAKARILAYAMALLIMSGCATMPTQEESSKLDYDDPLAIDYGKTIRDYFEQTLFDSYPARYKFEPPRQYWYKPSVFSGGQLFSRGPLYSGYMVIVWVNAKNRLGAYVGMKKFGFLFKNNELIKVVEPEEFELANRKR